MLGGRSSHRHGHSSVFRILVFAFVVFTAVARPGYAEGPVESAATTLVTDGAQCQRYLAALARVRGQLAALPSDALARLDPQRGTGYLPLDVTAAFPEFLVDGGHAAFPWPARGTWAFDGDPNVPHYVDYNQTGRALAGIVGEPNVAELRAFAQEMTRYLNAQLPPEERRRLAARGLQLTLDLAEMRVSDGAVSNTGQNVHIDWFPREGMVMVIPLYGNRTTIYHPGQANAAAPAPDRITANLISAYGRWTNFHAFDENGEPRPGQTRQVRVGEDRQTVPLGMLPYLRSRGTELPDDVFPGEPGMLPTIHRAGSGGRMVMVLNFSYSPIPTAPTTVEAPK